MPLSIHDCLLKVTKRAERAADEKLTATFVDAAPLLASVSTPDNQVIYGRRGTGKTHILKYLYEEKVEDGDIAVFLDLREIGSNGSIYGDQGRSLPKRATPLLLDVLQAMHEETLRIAVDDSERSDLSVIGPKLDAFASSISEVRVEGTTEVEQEATRSAREMQTDSGSATLSGEGVAISAHAGGEAETTTGVRHSLSRSGTESYYVNFGTVQSRLRDVLTAFGGRRVWLLLDEWSEVPYDLQPYLADLIRRCIIPVGQVSIKIAAIEHRTKFIIRHTNSYLGLEPGADISADVNLDDFMVFENDAERAKEFFSNLLFKHYRATDGLDDSIGPQSAQAFISEFFTQITAFEEFVRATEGVPRDAVNLASKVAQRAYNRRIGVDDVRKAARDWYLADKTAALKSDKELEDLLHWIIEEVIAHRRARAFLLESNVRPKTIDTLFDSRLLHVLKRNISSHDNPGVRYDVYKLDYGCYVDLITTTKAPMGLLPGDCDNAYVEVPPDDYRAIRNAILNIDEFAQEHSNRLEA